MKITPFLWYDREALEAAKFYTSIFPNSEIHGQEQFENSGPDENQTVQIVSFRIANLEMQAMNAGPRFTFNPSISFFVSCPTREEVEWVHNTLIEWGSSLMPLGSYDWNPLYAWIADKYGLSWQIKLDETLSETMIVPSLLFTQDNFWKAEEALNRYTSLFGNSSIDICEKYPSGPLEGNILYSECSLDGSRLILMDGPGEHGFVFNEAISFLVDCADQVEVDHFWNGLIADGGAESQCGWLKDACGVSWQIVPEALGECMSRDTSGNVMKAMLGMKKLVVADLEKAVTE